MIGLKRIRRYKTGHYKTTGVNGLYSLQQQEFSSWLQLKMLQLFIDPNVTDDITKLVSIVIEVIKWVFITLIW